MSISNIEATLYFDEVRSYFGPQTHPGKAIELIIKSERQGDGGAFIGIFDGNNSDAKPLVLMLNRTATGRNWENQIGSGETFHIVNKALLAFAHQKEVWRSSNYDFTLEDASVFLVDFMKRVSSFLR